MRLMMVIMLLLFVPGDFLHPWGFLPTLFYLRENVCSIPSVSKLNTSYVHSGMILFMQINLLIMPIGVEEDEWIIFRSRLNLLCFSKKKLQFCLWDSWFYATTLWKDNVIQICFYVTILRNHQHYLTVPSTAQHT